MQKCCVILYANEYTKETNKKLASLIIHEVGHFAKNKRVIDSSFIPQIYSLMSMMHIPPLRCVPSCSSLRGAIGSFAMITPTSLGYHRNATVSDPHPQTNATFLRLDPLTDP